MYPFLERCVLASAMGSCRMHARILERLKQRIENDLVCRSKQG